MLGLALINYGLRRLVAFALLLLLAGACDNRTPEQKLAEANMLLSQKAGDAFARSRAWGLYKDVYASAEQGSQLKLDAGFGVGMAAFIDLIHAASRLANPVSTPVQTAQTKTAPLPAAKDLLPLISTLVDVVLDQGIIQPWQAVVNSNDYSFTFEPSSFVIPAFSSDGTDINLSGTWDLTEIRIVYGLLQNGIAAYRYIELYSGLLETAIDAALTDATLPDLPDNPGAFPAWIMDLSTALGYSVPPWVNPDFGVMRDTAPLLDLRQRASDGFNQIVAGLEYLNAESNDKNDVFPRSEFVKQLLIRIGGLDETDAVVTVVNGVFPATNIQELFMLLRDSLDNDNDVFLPPAWFWDLIEGLELIAPDYPGPVDPVGLRIPAINLSRLFTHPIVDLKDRENGLLPYYCLDDEVGLLDCTLKGEFVAASEQEPYNDADADGIIESGEFSDIGVDGFVDANYDGMDDGLDLSTYAGDGLWQQPLALNPGDAALDPDDDDPLVSLVPALAHYTPQGAVELPNGIVDPVYIFFGNPSFNQFLLPISNATDGSYQLNLDVDYSNRDLMRFISSIIWIIESLPQQEDED